MGSADDVRKAVSEAYSIKVTRAPGEQSAGGLVGGCCCASPDAAEGLAALAGYSRSELRSVPAGASDVVFGCGNPVAASEMEPGEIVLDLGSGAGMDLLLAAERVGPDGRVIGIDMTDEMVARAQQNIAKSGVEHIEVRQGLIEDLPVDDASVDWVISNCVINLSPEKERVFSEIARVLKPGGRFLFSDIVASELPPSVRGNAALYASCIAGAISEEAYISGLEGAGLSHIEVLGRLVYDTDQLMAIAEGDAMSAAAASCCGVDLKEGKLLHSGARALSGKVWSATFRGRKGRR